MVRIKLPPILKGPSGGLEAVEVSGQTVGECLKSLEEKLPKLRDHLFDRQGRLLNIFGIYLNSGGIYPVSLDTPVKDGDEIVILNFIMGG